MGNLLLERRKALRYSLRDVAEITGISQGNLSKWENGEIQSVQDNSMFKVAKIADLYNVTVDEVMRSVENNYIHKHHGHKEEDDMNKVECSRLRARRLELGYDTMEVAEAIGICEGTFSQWEMGYIKRPKTRSAVMSLAELYGWGVNETYMAIEEAYNTKYPWLAGNKSEVTEEVNDPFTAKHEDSIEVSGANDSDSDEESIIDIAREAYENAINEPVEVETPSVIDNTITCGKAIDMALDAVFAWGRNRQVYDDMLETMKTHAPTDVNNRTIKESQIETYILSLIYGNVSFDTFCTVKDSLKSCLGMMKSFEEE